MKRFPSVDTLSPEQFEQQVKKWLEQESGPLEDFSATHQESVPGRDGEYSIDVIARFTAFGGARFLVVVECKKHKHPIKRDVVQIIHQKQISVGANKAIVFATADFQSGAKEFASAHGISLVQIVGGYVRFIQASAARVPPIIPDTADDFVGIVYSPRPGGKNSFVELISTDMVGALGRYLRSAE